MGGVGRRGVRDSLWPAANRSSSLAPAVARFARARHPRPGTGQAHRHTVSGDRICQSAIAPAWLR